MVEMIEGVRRLGELEFPGGVDARLRTGAACRHRFESDSPVAYMMVDVNAISFYGSRRISRESRTRRHRDDPDRPEAIKVARRPWAGGTSATTDTCTRLIVRM